MGFFKRNSKTRITDSAVYWEINLADKIGRLSNGSVQISEDWIVSMSVESDIRNKIDQNGLVDVLQDMVNDAEKAGVSAAMEIISIWKTHASKGSGRRLSVNEQIYVTEGNVLRRGRFNQKAEAVIKRLKSELGKIPQQRWEEFKRTKKEYRNYKIKAGFKVGATTGGIALAIGSTAASVPTGGASIALTVIGLQRSVFSLVEQIRDLSYEGETVFKNLVSAIESLENAGGPSNGSNHSSRYNKPKKGALRAREVGSNIVQAAMGGLNPTSSIKGCSNDFDLLTNKTKGIIRKCNQLASKIDELLVATEKLNKNLATRSFSPNRQRKVQQMIAANEAAIHATITKCIETRERWSKLDYKLPKLKKRIEDLRLIAGKNFVKGAAFIPVLVDLGLAAWSADDAFLGAEKVWEFATSSVGSTMDVINVSADMFETATG